MNIFKKKLARQSNIWCNGATERRSVLLGEDLNEAELQFRIYPENDGKLWKLLSINSSSDWFMIKG